MKKLAYIKPATNIVVLQSDAEFMAASSNSITTVNGLNDPFTFGGQSDGTHDINAKNGGDLWDFDEED